MTQDGAAPWPPTLAVIIPVLNEARYVDDCLRSLLPQTERCGATVMVMDGGSTDATRAIVASWGVAHPCIQLIDNPRRIQSAALNIAARMAPPSVTLLLRADAHADYPPDFIAQCVAALEREQATSVVVPMHAIGRAGLQIAIAAVQRSRLGNGGSPHRLAGASRFVDHGHHALFDRRFFLALGGYDESFTHNEDAELDRRAILAGGRIWLCGEAAISYYPRTTLGSLFRQYHAHGRGRMQTLVRHRMVPRLRQLAAPAIVLGIATGLLLVPFTRLGLAPAACYAAACIGWAMVATVRSRDLRLLGIAPAAIAIHLGWGSGFLAAAARQLTPRSPVAMRPDAQARRP